jgi:PAS domain S-box-containing protein
MPMSSTFPEGSDGVGLRPTPEIVTVPSRDRAFRVHVEAAITKGIATPDDLTQEIRRAYPGVRVHRSEPLGTLTPGGSRWYVYRDGEVLGAEPGSDWWADESLARTSMDAAGRYTDANASAAELFGVQREAIIGANAGAFTRHEDSDDVRAGLFTTLLKTGELSSTAVVVRPDGSEVRVEFHTGRRHDGVFVTVMRALTTRGVRGTEARDTPQP